jgi:hypothetical protein
VEALLALLAHQVAHQVVLPNLLLLPPPVHQPVLNLPLLPLLPLHLLQNLQPNLQLSQLVNRS